MRHWISAVVASTLIVLTVVVVQAQAPWTLLSEQEPRTPVISMGWIVAADPFRTGGARYTLRVPAFKSETERWPVLEVGRDVAVIVGRHGLNGRIVARTLVAYTPRPGQVEGDTRYTIEAPAELPVLVETILDQPKPTSWWDYGPPLPQP